LFLLMVPRFPGAMAAHESSAASTLLTTVTLQDRYATAHPNIGFACELPLLKAVGQQLHPDDSWEFLATGVHSGYRFLLVSCVSEANRARARYQVVAVPVEPGKTGVKAFCADQTGVMRFDPDGSAINCLASGQAIESASMAKD
jgi:hypothetical protein